MNSELCNWYGGKIEFEYDAKEDFDIDDFFAEHDFPELRESTAKQVATKLYMDFESYDPFPYGMDFEELRSNKDGVLDDIIEDLYDSHEPVTNESIQDAVFAHAGLSRDIQPKITVADIDPNRDYTREEIIDILNKKPSLADIIASAASRYATQNHSHESIGQNHNR